MSVGSLHNMFDNAIISASSDITKDCWESTTNTQKGVYGDKTDEKGHIFPLFVHEYRCWMWKTGYGTIFFEEEDNKTSLPSSNH